MHFAHLWERFANIIRQRFVIVYVATGLGMTLLYSLVSYATNWYDSQTARDCYELVTGSGAPFDCATLRANAHVALDSVNDTGYVLFIVCMMGLICGAVYYRRYSQLNYRHRAVQNFVAVPFAACLVGTLVMVGSALVWFLTYA